MHFEFVLRGMARLGLVPPLGGTSNIFVTRVLHEIAISADKLVAGGIPREVAEQMVGAWDPWCVAEDADIADYEDYANRVKGQKFSVKNSVR